MILEPKHPYFEHMWIEFKPTYVFFSQFLFIYLSAMEAVEKEYEKESRKDNETEKEKGNFALQCFPVVYEDIVAVEPILNDWKEKNVPCISYYVFGSQDTTKNLVVPDVFIILEA